MHQNHDDPAAFAPDDGEDGEMRRVLALASRPSAPPDAAARLMARIAREEQASGPVRLPPSRAAWRLAALPLAASLALGVVLGAQGRLDFILPAAITDAEAASDDVPLDDLGGMGEADDAAGENLS